MTPKMTATITPLRKTDTESHQLIERWLNGPPYGIVEHVFDENDFGSLYESEAVVPGGAAR
ncbi:hypothetical protein [Sulfuritalea hydrogenivorans]|uniref:Uncharacterized protein n=1 Tax=Sulfuritalea hydrogenivorans sk43H TaxID=1223802 RepID=W0SKE1_9PROT|nr:hypothetical protein [Sulfuritalea hydrogenivorans]BAO31275.1 hypothetical protein SUTH_03505 [Sulfuritalea hydrogenivorans sk43H]